MALLVLEDGSVFRGISTGASHNRCGEVVFHTAMSGYQEILTDPSYAGQIIVFTAPHIGNTGINEEDEERRPIHAAGIVTRQAPIHGRNFRSTGRWRGYLEEQGIPCIAGIDTRRLTRLLRTQGAMRGCLLIRGSRKSALESIAKCPRLEGRELASKVSCELAFAWTQPRRYPPFTPAKSPLPGKGLHVVVYDFGVKHSILRLLVERGCRVTVVPARTPAAEVLERKPHGVLLSNGPGDPQPCNYAIEAIRTLLNERVPLFGICLGHQLLALSCGARTAKMKFGHHGANHPVQDIATGRVLITSQNHGFMVEEESLPANLEPTHRSLFDGSLQGIALRDRPAFGFQGHPEAGPGPHDAHVLLDRFLELMRQHHGSAALPGADASTTDAATSRTPQS